MMGLRTDLMGRLARYKRAQIAMATLLTVYVIAAFLLWIHPANADLAAASSRIVFAQAELKEGQNRAKSLPMAELKLLRIRQPVEGSDNRNAGHQDLARLTNEMNRISQNASLEKLSWHLNFKPDASNQLTELPIQLAFEGDFKSGLIRFLQETEEMQRLTRIRKLNLKANDAHDGHVTGEMSMAVYCGEE